MELLTTTAVSWVAVFPGGQMLDIRKRFAKKEFEIWPRGELPIARKFSSLEDVLDFLKDNLERN